MRVLISALILIIAYLLVTGCQSLQPQSNPTRLPEPTPTTRPSEPTPTAVSGTPVATPVPSPSATSPPAATPTTAPVLPATPTTSVATTPTTVTDTGIAAIRDYLDQRRREGASVEEIANEVNGAPLPAGTNVRALPVAASAEGELPIVLVVYHAPTISQGHAIFWWERDELRHQRFASDEFPDGSGPGAIGPRSPFVAARQQVRDATVELGIVYDASFGGSAESQVFRLFRLEQGSWRTLWDGLADGGNNWKTSHANVTLANASSGSPDAFARMVLRSSSWNDPDGKGGFFLESNPGPHRYFVDVWERRGDRYELTESRV